MKNLLSLPLSALAFVSLLSSTVLADSPSIEALHNKIEALTAELNQYKAEEARVRYTICL